MPRLFLLLICCACAPAAPELTFPEGRGIAPPLSGVSTTLARADALTTAPDPAATLAARVAALRARADALRGPVIPGPVRNRLRTGIDASALQ